MGQSTFAPDRVRAALDRVGFSGRILEFPSSTRTAEAAAQSVGTRTGQIVKSLVFVADARLVLALVSGANRLDQERLGALLGMPVQKADANTVRELTGFAIGGVPPIGFPVSVPTYIDRDLMQYDIVWAAAGTPRHVFAIAPAELLRITAGTVAELRAVNRE